MRPFLVSTDDALWRTGIWAASHHPGWSDLIVTGVRTRLEALARRREAGGADALPMPMRPWCATS